MAKRSVTIAARDLVRKRSCHSGLGDDPEKRVASGAVRVA